MGGTHSFIGTNKTRDIEGSWARKENTPVFAASQSPVRLCSLTRWGWKPAALGIVKQEVATGSCPSCSG